MHDILRVGVIYSLYKTLHVAHCLLLSEDLVHLLADLVEKWLSIDILHDKINVLDVIVGLVILDNVRMI